MYNYLFKKEIWTAYYERINDNRIYTSQEFSTAQECANWMNKQRALEAKTPTGKYNFECGLNCNPPTAINGPFVCNKTFDN